MSDAEKPSEQRVPLEVGAFENRVKLLLTVIVLTLKELSLFTFSGVSKRVWLLILMVPGVALIALVIVRHGQLTTGEFTTFTIAGAVLVLYVLHIYKFVELKAIATLESVHSTYKEAMSLEIEKAKLKAENARFEIERVALRAEKERLDNEKAEFESKKKAN
jgi:hypothetical protein